MSVHVATWCPPCKMIGPKYEELSKKYTDVAFGKVDVDDNSDAALDFEVSSVPTFVFFDGEEMKTKLLGANETLLEKHVQEL